MTAQQQPPSIRERVVGGLLRVGGHAAPYARRVYLVLRRSEVSLPSLPIDPAVLVAGLTAIGLLLVVIRWLTLPSVHAGLARSIGAKYGIWVALLAGIVEVAAAVAELRASGAPLPWPQPETG